MVSLCFSEEKKNNSGMKSGLELITTQEHSDIFNSFCICFFGGK